MRRRRQVHDALIVGGGIAGLSCALHAARLGLRVACFEQSELFGGAVATVGALEGYPAARPVSGAELAAGLVEASRGFGVDIVAKPVEAIRLDGTQKALTAGGQDFTARHLVLATGARPRRLEVPGEDALTGRGVSQCAFCDAGLFRDEPVVVVGGGDAALQEALHLAQYARSVTLLVRGAGLRAKRCYVQRASDDPRFTFRWNSRVEAIIGGERVEGLRIVGADGQAEELPCSGVFVFIGGVPNSDFVPEGIERDAEGRIVTDAALRTSLPGVFAVGAVRAGYGGQLAQAAAEGITAAQALV